jgi:predicted transcriptional regulator with HTH domain
LVQRIYLSCLTSPVTSEPDCVAGCLELFGTGWRSHFLADQLRDWGSA